MKSNVRKITYYKPDGVVSHQQELTIDHIMDTVGMMMRCTIFNGEVYEGYSDVVGDSASRIADWDGRHIFLWKWAHWDEETQRLVGDKASRYDMVSFSVPVDEIIGTDAILYSGPRWGGRLCNHFFLDI